MRERIAMANSFSVMMKTALSENVMNNIFNSRLKKEYTLNDLFIKNNRLVFLIPTFLFLMTPVAEFFLCSANVEEHPFANWYTYPAIVYAAMFFGLIFAVIAYGGFFIKNKGNPQELKKAKKPEIYLFLAFTVVAVAATFFGSFQDDKKHAFRGIYYVLAEFWIYFGCCSFISEEKLKKIIIYAYISLSFFLDATQLVNEFIVKIPMYNIFGSIAAVFQAANYYGYFLALALMLTVAMLSFETGRKEKIFLIVSFLVNSATFAIVNCLGTFLACIAGFAVLFIVSCIKNKRFAYEPVILFISFLIICFVVGLRYNSFFSDVVSLFGDIEMIAEDSENAGNAGTGRWAIWMATLGFIKEKPWFGWGAFGIYKKLNDSVGINAAHNEYLQYAADYGIPAAILYVSGLMCIFIRAWKNRLTADKTTVACLIAAFTYVVSALFGNNIFCVGPFFYIFLGLSVNYAKAE